MPDRAIVAVLLTAAGIAMWRLLLRRTARRAARIAAHDPLLSGIDEGAPVIVYFTTPDCVVCRVQQEPALARVAAAAHTALRIIRVDASRDPDAATRWGILTAPTTIVLDAQRRLRHVNHGLTSTDTLLGQLAGLARVGIP